MAAMFVNELSRNEQSLQRTFHICFLPSFGSFDQAVSEEKILQKLTNKKQELPMAAMLLSESSQNKQSLQRTFHICFLPSIGSFDQVVSQEKIFRNQPIRNKSCLWRTCFLMNRAEISNLYKGPSIDSSYQVSVYLALLFQRRRFFQKSTNQKQELPMVAMFNVN